MLDLDEIYAAIDDDGALDRLAEAVGRACNTRSAQLQWRDGESGAAITRASYWPADAWQRYLDEFVDRDPWLPTLAMVGSGIIMGDALVPPAVVEASALGNELFRPLGDDTARMLGWLSHHSRPPLLMAVHRAGADRSFDGADAERLDTVRVHVERVFATRARLREARRSATELLDATGKAVLAVDRDLRVLDCSKAARAHFDKGCAIRCHRGQLCFVVSSLDAKVRAAVRCVLHRAGSAPTSFNVPQAGAPQPLLLCVLPADCTTSDRALLFLEDPAALPGDAARTALAELYGLSAAEVSVALVLAQGEEVSAIADSRGVTRETVRTQAKHIYAKTGTGRQAALARLVAGLPTLRR